MNVCYCFNADWAKYIPVQLYSLFNKNPEVTKVYFITESLNDELYKATKQWPIVWLRPPDNAFNNVNVKGRFTVTTLWRLLIPHFLEESKCLYLDADTLVTDNLSEFYNIAPETIAGVVDTGISRRHLDQLGFKGNYINAGVLLMNLEGIRRQNIHNKWVSLANKRRFGSQDQDIINITCTPHLVSNEYNSSESTGYHNDPKIIHYAGVKSDNWVRDMPYGKVWSLMENIYDTKNNSLRMVRTEPKTTVNT